jgi:hypothetical protein
MRPHKRRNLIVPAVEENESQLKGREYDAGIVRRQETECGSQAVLLIDQQNVL